MQRDKVPGRQDKGRLRVVACAPGTHILPFPTSHPQKESTLFRANTFRVLENEHMSQDMGFPNGGGCLPSVAFLLGRCLSRFTGDFKT